MATCVVLALAASLPGVGGFQRPGPVVARRGSHRVGANLAEGGDVLAAVAGAYDAVLGSLGGATPDEALVQVASGAEAALGSLASDPRAVPLACAAAAATAMGASGVALLRRIDDRLPEGSGEVYPSGRYDPGAAAAYFGRRPAQTAWRSTDRVIIRRLALRIAWNISGRSQKAE